MTTTLIEKGQRVNIISFKTPKIGCPYNPRVVLSEGRTVTKAGAKTFFVDTQSGSRRFAQADIGKRCDGMFRNQSIIITTSEDETEEAIKKVQEIMLNAIADNIDLYRELVQQHQITMLSLAGDMEVIKKSPHD